MISKPKHIAVIGAGMAGIRCAHGLAEHGLSPVIFEKSRGVGGRLATRRAGDGLAFDLGAQFVTIRSPAFMTAMTEMTMGSTVAAWRPRLEPPDTGTEGWMVGVPSMNALVKPWIADIPLHLETRVEALERSGAGWRVHTGNDAAAETFDAVVLAIPAPQARVLVTAVAEELAEPLDAIVMDPCWAVVLAFDEPLAVDFDGWRSRECGLSWACRNGSKPGRHPGRECWVLHGAPAWSRDRQEMGADAVADELTAAFAGVLAKPLPRIVYRAAHRWLYAQTRASLGRPFLHNQDATLYVGGDWCLGARVEFAFTSGEAMAEAIIERVRPQQSYS